MQKFLSSIIFILVIFPFLSYGEGNLHGGNETIAFESCQQVFDFYNNSQITDGPFIFFEEKETLVKWVADDQLMVEKYVPSKQEYFQSLFKVFPDKDALKKKKFEKPDFKQEFHGVDKILAISDVHGQLNLFFEFLLNHKVIDIQGNWIYGTGHLMIDGDIFDRGAHVTEILWLVYQLEVQAEQKGGKVHFILGNHEYMVLEKDLRYIHEKYAKTAQLMDTSYDHLYSTATFLGRWLRTKPVMVKINDILFVHGGASPKFTDYGLSPLIANEYFLNNIIDKNWEIVKQDSVAILLDGSDGPLWYRGYFRDDELTTDQVDEILAYFNVSHIVVGHTSQDKVTPLFEKKIIGIDSSIKNGKGGEVLIIENNSFFAGTKDGTRTKL